MYLITLSLLSLSLVIVINRGPHQRNFVRQRLQLVTWQQWRQQKEVLPVQPTLSIDSHSNVAYNCQFTWGQEVGMHRLDNVIISNWFCQFAPGVKREEKQYLDTKWAIYKSAIEESVRDNESCSQNPSGVTSEKRMTSIGKINHFYFCFWCFIAFLPPPPSHSPPNTCSAWSSYLLIDSLNWERLQFFCVRNKPILSLNHASRKPSFFVRVRVTISPPNRHHQHTRTQGKQQCVFNKITYWNMHIP